MHIFDLNKEKDVVLIKLGDYQYFLKSDSENGIDIFRINITEPPWTLEREYPCEWLNEEDKNEYEKRKERHDKISRLLKD